MRPFAPLLRAAAEELQRHGGAVDGPIRVEATGPDRTHIMVESAISPSDILARTTESPPMPAHRNGAPVPQRGKLFSPIEEAILAAVTRDWQTKVELARACGQPVSSFFGAILSNLVERQWLESGRQGYRLPDGE